VGVGLLVTRGDGSPRAAVQEPSSVASSATAASSAAAPTADGVSGFVQRYLQTAPHDPATAFAMLTPAYRHASGGLPGYRQFWGNVTGVKDISAVTPTLAPLGATYTYTYTLRGQGKRTERVHLDLVFQDGGYLISGSSSTALEHGHGKG
jgi:hypothetical protein